MTTTRTPDFQFQQFTIQQDACAMKVGTDGVLLGAWAPVAEVQTILDIGTGTGLIALMLAQRQPAALVTGVEIDAAAAVQAQANAEASPFRERMTVAAQSIQDFTDQQDARFDLIVSNPPFFSGGVLSDQLARAEV
ncbi:MAG: methyltransferase, partial [Bacteroidota bacterium]